jgi:glycosyltransferase involved in cell wall biosynthesis
LDVFTSSSVGFFIPDWTFIRPMSELSAKWICCQLGAREHYAVPRALHSRNQLAGLITDIWVAPRNVFGLLKSSLRDRFHADLGNANVHSANRSLLHFEFLARLRGLKGWALTMARNRWFQHHAVGSLRNFSKKSILRGRSCTGPFTVFAYSYAALDILRWSKAQGWRAVLGQIDPGFQEERLVQRVFEQSGGGLGHSAPAPPDYWQLWREECSLADTVVVNSEWSRQGLLSEGIAATKLRVVPLAFEIEARGEVAKFRRSYPRQFTIDRPMRVLFLGQVNLRKGIQTLLEAVRQLRSEPVEFWFVGPVQITIPEDLASAPNVRWLGPVSRQATARFYREADVFIFPTFSDGFGLTQLEAQAWQLPVIASRHCGEVTIDGVNGVRLAEVNGPTITGVLRRLAANPRVLQEYAAHSAVDKSFSLSVVGGTLLRKQ